MNVMQLVILGVGAALVLILAAAALTGPSSGREATRRLQAVRFRHSESAVDKVEAQYRKAVANRKPTTFKKAGSGSRIEALALRLHKTGKGWTLTQYLYTSVGIAIGLAALIAIKTGAPLLGLGAGVLVGAGIPHFFVGRAINKRKANFVARFPDALELLVRGLRSGLPITETLGVVASELPGPVGEEFKLVTDRIKVGRTMEEEGAFSPRPLNLPPTIRIDAYRGVRGPRGPAPPGLPPGRPPGLPPPKLGRPP